MEQKSTATEPEHSSGILNSLLESVAEGVLIVDQGGKITTFNQNFLSLLKIPGELTDTSTDPSILLKYAQDQLDDPADFSGKITKSINDPGITCQGTMHFKDGQVVTWSSLAKKTGNTISGRIWIFRDISDQTRTERQLITVKEQLRAAEETLHHQRNELERQEEMIQKCEEIMNIFTRSTPDGILTSIEGTIVEANEQFAGMLGYSSDELAGRSLVDFFSPETPGETRDALRSGSGGKYEFIALHRNGSSFKAEATGYTVGYRGDTILVSIIHGVAGDTAAIPRVKSAGSGGIPAETGRDESGSPERIPESCREGRSGRIVRISRLKPGETNLVVLNVFRNPGRVGRSGRIVRISRLNMGEKKPAALNVFQDPARRSGRNMVPVCRYRPASRSKNRRVFLFSGKLMMHTRLMSGKCHLPRTMISLPAYVKSMT